MSRDRRSKANERGPALAALGQERMEVAPSVVHERDRLAVDQRPTHRQTANRLGDRREPIGEVRAAAAPDLRALAQLADEDAEAIMLDFVQPTGSGGRAINERGFRPAEFVASGPGRRATARAEQSSGRRREVASRRGRGDPPEAE